MSNDKMRAAFEANYPQANLERRDGDGGYQGGRTADMYHSWQAATALCTDLLQAKDLEIHTLKFCIDGEAALTEAFEERDAEIARLTAELARVKERAAMYDVVRKLQPLEFTNMFVSNIRGCGRFDDLVLTEMLAAAPKPPGAA